MKTAILPITAVVAAVAIAGCGGSGSSSGSAAHGRAATVSARQISGAGSVLVDARGAALYTPTQERGGGVRCVGACASVWKPLTLGAGTPTGPGTLGTVRRPDGSRQVTANGSPLYSFAPEGAGSVKGDGVADAFGGRRFTWHVVTSSGAAASGGSGSSGAGSYGY